MSSYRAATGGYRRLFQAPSFFRSATNTEPDHILRLVVDEEMDMVALLFKWVTFIIGSLVFQKKGLLVLFRDCLNVVIT